MYDFSTTICAQASAAGQGAIAVIRISGPDTEKVFRCCFVARRDAGSLRRAALNAAGTAGAIGAAGTADGVGNVGALADAAGYEARRMYFGTIRDEDGNVIDEVMAAFFRAPHSYTGEDSAEIYCHGSQYIVSEILRVLISRGAVQAGPGEFTQRAFLNGKMDLAQAEAVADLIASETKAAHDVALQQMRGGYSLELKDMRQQMLELVALMELELDFSEEDVEFADRTQVLDLIDRICAHISRLADSFSLGNAIRSGIPVAIVGAVNAGKSTLLNALLKEERAIVSDIAGTTRDTVEDTLNIGGMAFRFIDTAGIRETSEAIEKIGIQRTWKATEGAYIVLLLIDATRPETFHESLSMISSRIRDDQTLLILINKTDLISPRPPALNAQPAATDRDNPLQDAQPATQPEDRSSAQSTGREATIESDIEATASGMGLKPKGILALSAKQGTGLQQLTDILSSVAGNYGANTSATLVTNMRHYQALRNSLTALNHAREAITQNISTEFVTQDIREALDHIGVIVGEVTSTEILSTIFSTFCIGK